MVLAPFAVGLSMIASVAAGSPAVNVQPQNNQTTTKTAQPSVTMVTVKEGDTLTDIANQYQSTYVRLFDANNNIQDPNIIHPGDSIRIPSADEHLPDRPLPTPAPAPDPAVNTLAPTPAAVSAPVAALPVASSGPVAGCGDNSYANYIYSHESGCRTTAMSPNGCYGIGQACPASKIAYCGADYACQNAFFTAYAGKYGGWAGAYAFWISHGWW
ncbi:MAG: LysM peptidoglycan-binding domain-containing protein [Candidatus Saccharimonadales bacterium]